MCSFLQLEDINDNLSDITDSLSMLNNLHGFSFSNSSSRNIFDISDSNLETVCKFESNEFYTEFVAMFKFVERFTKAQKELVRLVLIEYIELGKLKIVTNNDGEEEDIDAKYDLILLLVDNELETINRAPISKTKKRKPGLTVDVCNMPYLSIGLI
jgi:hypothetical protein